MRNHRTLYKKYNFKFFRTSSHNFERKMKAMQPAAIDQNMHASLSWFYMQIFERKTAIMAQDGNNLLYKIRLLYVHTVLQWLSLLTIRILCMHTVLVMCIQSLHLPAECWVLYTITMYFSKRLYRTVFVIILYCMHLPFSSTREAFRFGGVLTLSSSSFFL